MWQQVRFALSDSTHRVLVKLASFLPGLLAMLVAVLLLAFVGALLAWLLRRILHALRFDERLSRSTVFAGNAGIQNWSLSHSPSVLLARVVFFGCVILGCIVGISALDAAYSNNSETSQLLLPYLTHGIGAIVIFLAGNLIARFLSRSVLIGAVNAGLHYARMLSEGVKWLVLTLTAAMVLDHLEIGGTVVDLAFGILFGGIVLTLSLAVGLGSRELVRSSIERTTERAPDAPPAAPPGADPGKPPIPIDALRHF
jgi:hypothetical protein